jgi:hypothetical protein
MLPGIENIDWQNIRHWRGPATNTPNLLRLLASNNPDVRFQAYLDFYDDYFDQQMPHPSLLYSIPFLLDLLRHENLEDKHIILSVLTSLAIQGSNERIIAQRADFGGQQWADAARQQYSLLREGLDIYLALLNSQDRQVRIASAGILSCFHLEGENIVRYLCSQIALESDVQVKGMVVKALGDLVQNNTEYLNEHRAALLELFEELTRSTQSGFVRFTAALSMIAVAHTEAPDAVDMIMLEAIQNADHYDDMMSGSLILHYGVEAIGKLEVERRQKLFIDLITHSEDASLLTFDTLPHFFPIQQTPVDPLTISANQFTILRAILKSDKIRTHQLYALTNYGLPSLRDDLRKFLLEFTRNEQL